MDDEYNPFDAAYESWINGQKQQMVNQLENAIFSKGEFVQMLSENMVDSKEALRIAIYLLDH